MRSSSREHLIGDVPVIGLGWMAWRGRGMFWFRFLGVGVAVKDVTRNGLMFSERYGLARQVRLGKWLVRFLPPWW